MLRTKLSLSIAVISSIMLLNFSLALAGPVMEFKDASHDFGVVEQGTQNKHVFTFKNTGDADLEIIEVKPSCGCTAALLSSKTIPPGVEGKLEVTFDSGKFKGKVKKMVSIETNEEPRVKTIKTPGLGPRVTKEVKEPSMVRKLYLNADVKYDKKKDAALKRAREAAMRQSKKAADQMGVELDTSLMPLKIEHAPKKISLGNIKLNQDYKVDLKLSTSQKDNFMIDKVAVSAPFTSAMITKLDILENSPGEVSVTVNVKKPGEVKSGKVMVYFIGSPVPVEVPVTWSAK
jgi:hypothetical protein